LQRVLVWTDKKGAGHFCNSLRKLSGNHLLDPFFLLGGLFLLFFDGGQGGSQDVGWGGTVTPFSAPMEIGWRAVQGKNQPRFFDRAWGVAEVFLRKGGCVEFVLGRAFPQEI